MDIFREKVVIFSWNVVGASLFFMLMECFAYFFITLLLESRWIAYLSHWFEKIRVNGNFFQLKETSSSINHDDDDDVQKEKEIVYEIYEKQSLFAAGDMAACDWSESPILLKDLQKVYPPAFLTLPYPLKKCLNCLYRILCCCCVETIPTNQNNSNGSSLSDNDENENEMKNRNLFKHAVRGLNLQVPIGETLGFLGINGAGKTTTLVSYLFMTHLRLIYS